MPRRVKSRPVNHDMRNGILLSLVAILFAIALFAGYWWVRKSKVPLDQVTNCPLAGPTAVHVLIFDRSDPISGQQAQQIRQRMQALKVTASFGQRFDFYTLEADAKAALSPILQVCSPGKPEEANALIENPDLIKRRYEEKFSTVVDHVTNQLLEPSVRNSSPIVESMKAAAITSFGAITKEGISVRITMISDMIQHSDAYSQFRAESSFADLSRNPVWPTIRPDLKGAHVDVLYLLRPEARRAGKIPIQNRGHELFWEQLIRASNGFLESFVPI